MTNYQDELYSLEQLRHVQVENHYEYSLEDVILLLLSTVEQGIKGYQKFMFEFYLSIKEGFTKGSVENSSFILTHNGLENRDFVYAIDQLEMFGEIQVKKLETDFEFSITPKGIENIKSKQNKISSDMYLKIIELRKKWDLSPLHLLILYSLSKYPEIILATKEYQANLELINKETEMINKLLADLEDVSSIEKKLLKPLHIVKAERYSNISMNDAINEYSKAIIIDPEDPEVYVKRALLYKSKKQFNEALSDLDSAVKLNPKSAIYHYFKALVFQDIDKLSNVVEELEAAIKIEPDNFEWLVEHISIMEKLGKNESVLNLIDRAMELNPNDRRLLTSKIRILLNMGHLGEALQVIKRMEKTPDGFYPELSPNNLFYDINSDKLEYYHSFLIDLCRGMIGKDYESDKSMRFAGITVIQKIVEIFREDSDFVDGFGFGLGMGYSLESVGEANQKRIIELAKKNVKFANYIVYGLFGFTVDKEKLHSSPLALSNTDLRYRIKETSINTITGGFGFAMGMIFPNLAIPAQNIILELLEGRTSSKTVSTK